MKQLSVITIGLLVTALTVFGCATPSGPSATPSGPTATPSGPTATPSRPSGAAWVTLLDGPTGRDNWDHIGSSNWRVDGGVMQADKKAGKENGFLVSKNSYSNFVIRVEFWASADANSGIFMRCANPKVITDKSCYEANIYDQRPDPSFGTGGIVHHARIIGSMQKAGGKWNVYEITANGPHIVVVLNGVKTAELHHDQFANGPIALQHGSGVIKFRKVQIRPL